MTAYSHTAVHTPWNQLLLVGLAASSLLFVAAPTHAARELASWAFSNTGGYLTASPAGDFNGDGRPDFVIGAGWRITLHFGALAGPPFPSQSFLVPGGDYVRNLTTVGDLDNDGFDDLLVATLGTGVHIYRGGSIPDTTADLFIPSAGANFGEYLAYGDWNADGFSDAAISTSQFEVAGNVYVYYGGATLNAVSDLTIPADALGNHGKYSAAGNGDISGDGVDDLVIGGNPGVRVYYGGAGFDAIADKSMGGGKTVGMIRDWNGDGYGDLGVSSDPSCGSCATSLHVFHGPVIDGSDMVLFGWISADTYFASGNIDIDDATDAVVTNAAHLGPHVFFGGPNADNLPDVPPVPDSPKQYVAVPGDVNGDGYDDWLASSNFSFVGLYTAKGNFDLVTPNGGETFYAGSQVQVEWTGADIVNLDYSRDGTKWYTLAWNVGGAATNQHTVTLLAGAANQTARMRLVHPTTGTFDHSDLPFTVIDTLTVGVGSPQSPVTSLGPLPARAGQEIAFTMASPQTPYGVASDVEVHAFDAHGREVALLGRGLGGGGTVSVRWTPASHGMRAGVYWIRARSAAVGFYHSQRFVVID